MAESKITQSKRICQVEGCNESYRSKGYCNKHYLQIRNHGKILTQTKYEPNNFIVDGDVCKMSLNDTKGNIVAYAIIDTDDITKINHLKWGTGWAGYVTATNANGKKEKMHQFVFGAKKGMDIDHINGDRLDNRKSNLRFATRSQNCANSSERKTNSSGFKGVCLVREKWAAQVCCSYKNHHLGYFDSKVEAAKAYNSAAKILFGRFAYRNPV